MQACTVCRKSKPADQFLTEHGRSTKQCSRCRKRSRAATQKYRDANRDLCAARTKRWKKNRPEQYKQYYQRANLRRYGLEEDDYARLLKEQKGKCAICRTTKPGGRWKRLHIDHDHKTGKVRGLLCNSCNCAVGFLNEDPGRAAKLIEYLKRHK